MVSGEPQLSGLLCGALSGRHRNGEPRRRGRKREYVRSLLRRSFHGVKLSPFGKARQDGWDVSTTIDGGSLRDLDDSIDTNGSFGDRSPHIRAITPPLEKFHSCRSMSDPFQSFSSPCNAVLDKLGPLPAFCKPSHADWWADIDVMSVKDLETGELISKLEEVQIVPCTQMRTAFDNHQNIAFKPHISFGLGAPACHLELWLTLQKVSIVLHSEVLNIQKLKQCLQSDCMMDRLKLVVNPVNVQLPVKGARESRYVGISFGKRNVSCISSESGTQLDHVRFQINLAAKWCLRLAFQQLKCHLGSVVDILLIDWPGQTVVAATRLTVTPTFQELMG